MDRWVAGFSSAPRRAETRPSTGSLATAPSDGHRCHRARLIQTEIIVLDLGVLCA